MWGYPRVCVCVAGILFDVFTNIVKAEWDRLETEKKKKKKKDEERK